MDAPCPRGHGPDLHLQPASATPSPPPGSYPKTHLRHVPPRPAPHILYRAVRARARTFARERAARERRQARAQRPACMCAGGPGPRAGPRGPRECGRTPAHCIILYCIVLYYLVRASGRDPDVGVGDAAQGLEPLLYSYIIIFHCIILYHIISHYTILYF